MKQLFKILKRLILSLIVIIFLTGLIHWFLGYGYLITGVQHTYLKGRSGPGITDSHIFHNNRIQARMPKPWPFHAAYGNISLNEEELEYMAQYEPASFVILQNGELMMEHYWEGYDKDIATNAFSATKSVVGLLIGIAIEEGKIKSLDTPVSEYLDEFGSNGKEHITIRDVISMSSGLKWVESSKNPYSDNARAYYGTELREHIRGLEVEKTPGEIYEYKSGNTQILSFILEEATGVTTSKYFEEKLWNPLFAEHDALWNLDKENGDEKAFCCLYATPRDFARIGQLMLQEGKWNGKQILSSSFVQEATKPAPLKRPDGRENEAYGLHWWCGQHDETSFFYARGILGQYIFVIPELNVVAVRTGSIRAKDEDDNHPGDIWKYLDIILTKVK